MILEGAFSRSGVVQSAAAFDKNTRQTISGVNTVGLPPANNSISDANRRASLPASIAMR